jgi:hypothetical protein
MKRMILLVLLGVLGFAPAVEAATIALNVYSATGNEVRGPKARASAIVAGKINPNGKIYTCEDTVAEWRNMCYTNGQLNIELPEGEYSIEVTAWSHQKSGEIRLTVDSVGGFQEFWVELQPSLLSVRNVYAYNFYGTVYTCFAVANGNPFSIRVGLTSAIEGTAVNALEASLSQPGKSYGTIRAYEDKWICRTTRLPQSVYNLPYGTHFKVKMAVTDAYDELIVHGDHTTEVPVQWWFQPIWGKG